MSVRLMKLVIVLLLGAIVTVAVSWLCAAFVDPTAAAVQFDLTQNHRGYQVATSTLRRFGHTRVDKASFHVLEIDPETQAIRSAGMSQDEVHSSQSFTGWPMHAMSSTNYAKVTIRAGGGSSVGVARTGLTAHDAIDLAPFAPGPQGGGGWRALPLSFLWGGMMFNTMFYASVLWLLIFGPFALRTMRRRKRRLCEACGYPIGTSRNCTECGVPVRPGRPTPVSCDE